MFAGTGTALITPFKKDGSVDEEALRRLVDFQESNGIDVLLPCGSTGEASALVREEHLKVIEIVRDQARKAKVLAGAGSNSTHEAVDLSKKAADMGVDGILSVSPYYVKPTQEGIVKHYEAIASAAEVPIVIYNIPGRTGSNITVDTLMRLAETDGIVGVKEASGNMTQIMDILTRRPKGFEVLCGDDGLTLPIVLSGGDGVISVASNCCPALISDLVRNAKAGNAADARAIHERLLPLFRGLFVESNPIPIKYVMGLMGYGCGNLRLPLTELSTDGRAKLDPILKDLGIARSI